MRGSQTRSFQEAKSRAGYTECFLQALSLNLPFGEGFFIPCHRGVFVGLLQEIDRHHLSADLMVRRFGWDLNSIASSSERVLGSNRWLDMIMNFETEVEAIGDFHKEFERHTQLDDGEREVEFIRLLSRWLRLQHEFYLTENGVGKYMKLQPSYGSHLWREEGRLWLCPDDLRQFGDQARRFVQADEVVGKGLVRAYDQLYEMGKGGWTAIVSPTELYQKYNSGTDVLNLMWVVDDRDKDGVRRIKGKYVVLNQVLENEERRFLHNLFFLLGEGWEIENVLQGLRVDMEFIADNQLWIQGGYVEGEEYELMVERPNIFAHEQVRERDVLELVGLVNKAFFLKFGKTLVEPDEIEMLPVVQQIVEKYLPKLVQALWIKQSKSEYYHLLREMVYGSQQQWAERNVNIDVRAHMMDLIMGRFMGGFEVGWGGLGEGGLVSMQVWGSAEVGLEKRGYCKTHELHYDGDECPKCKRFSCSH